MVADSETVYIMIIIFNVVSWRLLASTTSLHVVAH